VTEGALAGGLGPNARWGALSHRLVGEIASIEWQLNLVIALATGRDAWAVQRALELVQRVTIEERCRLLEELDMPADGLPQTTAAWLKDLARVRNQLAHSWIVSASKEEVVFQTFRRGQHRQFKMTAESMAAHLRKSARVTRNLTWLETLVSDPLVWGELMGFDVRD